MKVLIICLSLVCLGLSAPQPRKLFHEHIEDFLDLITQESADEIAHLLDHYMTFEEFLDGIDYFYSNNFRDILTEMESLPEFNAVIDFLEKDNIDVKFLIDRFHEGLDIGFDIDRKQARREPSGKDLGAFYNDMIAVYPKESLAALYDKKVNEDEEFRMAMENLKSEEWNTILDALLKSETFMKETEALAEHGLNVHEFFNHVASVFGQN